MKTNLFLMAVIMMASCTVDTPIPVQDELTGTWTHTVTQVEDKYTLISTDTYEFDNGMYKHTVSFTYEPADNVSYWVLIFAGLTDVSADTIGEYTAEDGVLTLSNDSGTYQYEYDVDGGVLYLDGTEYTCTCIDTCIDT